MMSSSNEYSPSFPQLDTDPEAHAAALQKLAPKKSYVPWKHSRKQSDASSAHHSPLSSPLPKPRQPTREASTLSAAPQIVLLDGGLLNDHSPLEDGDDFKWVVVYENQRGLTIFSIPMYSKVALLPTDPPAFTIPGTEGSKKSLPEVSLKDYGLPDGSWTWCSSKWMIDMRDSDDGSLSYDGFEYNWLFRAHHWKPEGGFVRRRRWIRLMRRKAISASPHSPGSSVPPSSTSSILHRNFDPDDVWQGDADDWLRCHALMRFLNRDGLRLEVWKAWLGVSLSANGKRPASDGRLLTPDGLQGATPLDYIQPPLKYVEPVVEKHYREILALFIFPDSRAEWMELLAKKLGPHLGIEGAGLGLVDYYSYSSGVAALPDLKRLSSSSSSSH